MAQRTLMFTTILLLTALQPGPARTDGCMMPSNREWKLNRERSLINEPDQKALIFFDKGREQLIISPSYSGETNEFAWIVPVPARPKVEILQGAPFHELARLVEPEPPRTFARAKSMAPTTASPAGVTVLERKSIGDYDVTVLAATDSQALMYWLRNNQYHLPQLAEAPIQAYIKEGWTFVASKIKVHDSAKDLKSGTLTPLRLIFDAPNPIYPMRLSAANPEPFSLLVYVALPVQQGQAPIPFTLKTIESPGNSGTELREAAFSGPQAASYPTLAHLSRSGMQIYWMKTSMSPSNCDKDYVWASTTR